MQLDRTYEQELSDEKKRLLDSKGYDEADLNLRIQLSAFIEFGADWANSRSKKVIEENQLAFDAIAQGLIGTIDVINEDLYTRDAKIAALEKNNEAQMVYYQRLKHAESMLEKLENQILVHNKIHNYAPISLAELEEWKKTNEIHND